VSHPRSPKAPKPATPSEPEQAWPRLPRVESPPVPLQQVEQHGNEPHLAPAHLGPRTSSGLQSMMGSTSTKMDFDDEPHVGAAGAARDSTLVPSASACLSISCPAHTRSAAVSILRASVQKQ
jgi:hypothetical protein